MTIERGPGVRHDKEKARGQSEAEKRLSVAVTIFMISHPSPP
jgi:hypothetical protein